MVVRGTDFAASSPARRALKCRSQRRSSPAAPWDDGVRDARWIAAEGVAMRIEIVTVPYRYDELEDGLGAGPGALLRAGLLDRLTRAGLAVGEPQTALLPEADRDDDRTAVNIG